MYRLLLTLETNYGAFESLSLAVAPEYSVTAAAKRHRFLRYVVAVNK